MTSTQWEISKPGSVGAQARLKFTKEITGWQKLPDLTFGPFVVWISGQLAVDIRPVGSGENAKMERQLLMQRSCDRY